MITLEQVKKALGGEEKMKEFLDGARKALPLAADPLDEVPAETTPEVDAGLTQ